MSARIFLVCLISFLFAVDAKKSNRHDFINFKLSDAQKLQLKEFTTKGNHNDHTKKLTDDMIPGGTKKVWILESFYFNEDCEQPTTTFHVHGGDDCYTFTDEGQIFSMDKRYSETQPNSGCSIDMNVYASANCTGVGFKVGGDNFSGICTAGSNSEDTYNDVGESGIQTCHDTNPLEIEGAGLDDIRSNPSDYFLQREYIGSSTCEESNNLGNDYIKLDQCYIIAANNEASQSGVIKSGKFTKMNGKLKHMEFIDDGCFEETEDSGMLMNFYVCHSETTEEEEVFSMMLQDIMIEPNEPVSAPNEPVSAPNEAPYTTEENPCMAGTFQMNGKCTPCNMGTYSIDGAKGCDPCLPGTYSPGGLAECLECSKGFFSLAGSVSCELCPAGTYSDMMGSPNCKKCENGMMSAPGAEQCQTCSAP
jgi:hypothetical protein